MDQDQILVKIWGSRGSHPLSGAPYLHFGGNTSCIEMLAKEGNGEKRLIFDAGTGLGFLGLALKKHDASQYDIFLSHLHPDHICSLPHFFPIHQAGSEVNIYLHNDYVEAFEKARTCKIDLPLIMGYPLYPIHPKEFAAKINLYYFDSTEKQPFRVDGILLDHYEGAIAHRVVKKDKMIIYAPDSANNSLGSDKLSKFCQFADLLIWDAVYTQRQITKQTAKKHSAIESVIGFAKQAKVKKILFFHHSPLRNDMELRMLEFKIKKLAHGEVSVEFAKDGMEIIV